MEATKIELGREPLTNGDTVLVKFDGGYSVATFQDYNFVIGSTTVETVIQGKREFHVKKICAYNVSGWIKLED